MGVAYVCDVCCICAIWARQTLLPTWPMFTVTPETETRETETLETTLSDKVPSNKICRRASSEQRCLLDARRQILLEGTLSHLVGGHFIAPLLTNG